MQSGVLRVRQKQEIRRTNRKLPLGCKLSIIPANLVHSNVLCVRTGVIVSTIVEYMVRQVLSSKPSLAYTCRCSDAKTAETIKKRLVHMGYGEKTIQLLKSKNSETIVRIRDDFYDDNENNQKLVKLISDAVIQVLAVGFVPFVEDLSHTRHHLDGSNRLRRGGLGVFMQDGAAVPNIPFSMKRKNDDSDYESDEDSDDDSSIGSDSDSERDMMPPKLSTIRRRIPLVPNSRRYTIDFVEFPEGDIKAFAVDSNMNDVEMAFYIEEYPDNGEISSKMERAKPLLADYLRAQTNQASRDSASAAPLVFIDISDTGPPLGLDQNQSHSYTVDSIVATSQESLVKYVHGETIERQADHQASITQQLLSSIQQMGYVKDKFMRDLVYNNPQQFLPLPEQYRDETYQNIARLKAASGYIFTNGKPTTIPTPPPADPGHLMMLKDIMTRLCSIFGFNDSIISPDNGEYKGTALNQSQLLIEGRQLYMLLMSRIAEKAIREIDKDMYNAMCVAMKGATTNPQVSVNCRLIKYDIALDLWTRGAITGEEFGDYIIEQFGVSEDGVTNEASIEKLSSDLQKTTADSQIKLAEKGSELEEKKSKVEAKLMTAQASNVDSTTKLNASKETLTQSQAKATDVKATLEKKAASKPPAKKKAKTS